MSNQNEETQILSQEEEHLDSNDNPPLVVSEDNSKQNEKNNSNNIDNNLNVEETKKNKVNNNEVQTGQKNQNPNNQKQYKHYGHKSYHHDNLSNFQEPTFLRTDDLLDRSLEYIKYINHIFLEIFNGLTMTIDNLIKQSDIPEIIKRIIHCKQILIIINMINTQYLLSSIEGIDFLNNLNIITLRLMVFSIILLNIHYNIFGNKQFLEKDEELENFAIKRNPKLKEGRCENCHLLRICRSGHCYFCDKCVKKFHLHSDWFNMCIGASNELLYAITLCFTILYIFVSNIIFWYYLLVRTDILNYLTLVFTLFAVIGLSIIVNSFQFLYSFIFQNIFVNLTLYERQFTRRLTYLWKDERLTNFFNPFNKGLQRNLEEMFINLFDVDIYCQYKNGANQHLSEIIDDEKINNHEEENNISDDIGTFKLMIKLSEYFDPFITNKGNIYKFVDGNEIINWNRLIIFTPFDIINSPYKVLMVKTAKNMIQRKEQNLHNLENQKKEDENVENLDKSENKSNEGKENSENITTN